MKALVTGATGFIGANLTRELLARGYAVRALVRQGANRRNLAGLDVETICGDLRDRASLVRALVGCEVLFHAAAAYTFWHPHPPEIYEINVTGTRQILEAARAHGIGKVVYTSTESTIGSARNGLGHEELGADLASLAGHYKRSKLQAEWLVLEMARDGLPVVIVNPTTPIGAYDIKPTPTGQIIVDYLNRRMPAYVDTGLNLVDVQDVARGHVLALERGRPGERYILGNCNLTLRELFALLERVTGIPAPRMRMPLWLALAAGHVSQFVADHVTGRPPRIPLAAVQTACHVRHFDCSKAIRELGLPQTPIEQALERAASWFIDQGYARSGARAGRSVSGSRG